MDDSLVINKIHRIIMVGDSEYPEKTTIFKSNALYYHELIYHFSGKATVFFNDQVLFTSTNSLRYLPQGAYTKYTVEREIPGNCIDIFFTSNIPLSNNAFNIQVSNGKIAPLFKRIFTIWVQKEEGYYFECISLLYKILSEMQKTNYIPKNLFDKIKPAIEYIHENFLNTKTITATTLSNICGISYSYIKRIFALKYKTSPKRYIIQLKMNYACELLNLGEHSIHQISEICGYNDIYTFSHQFKSEFGISPSDYIKKCKSSK